MQKQRFDSRQVTSRYQAFLAGFLTVAGLLIITPIFSIFYGQSPFESQASLCFFTALVGAGVVACSLIGKDAFVGRNEGRHLIRFSLLYLLLGTFLLVQTHSQIKGIVVNGQLTDELLPLAALELIIMGLCLGYKSFLRKLGTGK